MPADSRPRTLRASASSRRAPVSASAGSPGTRASGAGQHRRPARRQHRRLAWRQHRRLAWRQHRRLAWRACAIVQLAFALLVAIALFGAAGCASSGASAARSAADGSVVEFREGGQTFTIVSDRYLADSGVPGETPSERRNAFYSVARENGLIKVATDERLAELIAALDSRGAKGAALEGDAPPDAPAYLEIRVGDRVRYVPKPSTSNPSSIDKGGLTMFTGFKVDMVSVFNEVQGFQNVSADNVTFEQPVLSPRLMKYISGR